MGQPPRKAAWDPKLNKREKRDCLSVTVCVSVFLHFLLSIFVFPDAHSMWPASSYSWDHYISPPQWSMPSNCEPKKKGGGIHTTRKRKQTKTPSFLKRRWYFDTMTRKVIILYSLTHYLDLICWPTLRVKLLSATINWPICLFCQLRLTVLFTAPKTSLTPLPLHTSFFLLFSAVIYFSTYRALRIPF